MKLNVSSCFCKKNENITRSREEFSLLGNLNGKIIRNSRELEIHRILRRSYKIVRYSVPIERNLSKHELEMAMKESRRERFDDCYCYAISHVRREHRRRITILLIGRVEP